MRAHVKSPRLLTLGSQWTRTTSPSMLALVKPLWIGLHIKSNTIELVFSTVGSRPIMTAARA